MYCQSRQIKKRKIMELYLENTLIQSEIEKHLENENATIKITSTDKQDKGKNYTVSSNQITSIDEDCEGMIIWWKQWSALEGKYFNNSAHFKSFVLVGNKTHELSNKFSLLVNKAFTKKELKDTISKNKTIEYENCCATHDYCDANMIMDEAFTEIIGYEIDLQNDADLDLWNNAWALSKANYFKI